MSWGWMRFLHDVFQTTVFYSFRECFATIKNGIKTDKTLRCHTFLL